MAEVQIVQDMRGALATKGQPAITRWNRSEGRPRTHDFDRALRAEIRDPLWMISRQWQMGEFHADDAGSPVLARMCVDVSPLNGFQAGQGEAHPADLSEPLEVRVQPRSLPLAVGGHTLSLDVRVVVGRRWLKMLARETARLGGLSSDYRETYKALYPVRMPDPALGPDASVCAHPAAWRAVSAVAGRVMDGVAFLEHLADPTAHAYDGAGATASDSAKLAALAASLQEWFAQLIRQPGGDQDSWQPDRLEYQFGVQAPDTVSSDRALVMRAEEYDRGGLDWYDLERRPTQRRAPAPGPGATGPVAAAVPRETHTFLPSSVVFEGMPDTRWWAFEDRKTNFGQIRPDTTDLGKLLLMEFGLVYANDWFVLPYTLPMGSVAEVKGIAISNVFGDRLWVEPLREQPAASWERWSMFTLGTTEIESQSPPARLVLLPAAAKIQEGPVCEEISLVRDEVANMVWAIEQRVPLAHGVSAPGSEAARELRAFLQQLIRTPVDPPEFLAPIRYQAMNTVPEQWIPFIPVHVEGSARETQLQRAALPRILDGDSRPPEKVRPRSTLLSANMPHAYYVHEEQVPRAGTVVRQNYRRTRWLNGTVFTWFAASKQTGRGEGASGLQFDMLANKKE